MHDAYLNGKWLFKTYGKAREMHQNVGRFLWQNNKTAS
jgi:hypothetical protein